jgi:DNA-binding LytR/AlgR family response regulator
MPKLRCLIVDDEEPAHFILQNYIAQVQSLQFVASALNAVEAINLLHAEKIDLIFLDINMPRMTGLEMLDSLTNPPKVILTTAYSEFALDSYEHGVVDYLMKPISFPRFLKAINKLMAEKPPESATVPEPDEAPVLTNFLWAKTDSGMHRVDYEDIMFVKSIGNYVRLTLKNGTTHLILQTSKELESVLPAEIFVRIHKSYLVNVSCVTRVAGGQLFIGKAELPVGAIFKKDFLRKLAQP